MINRKVFLFLNIILVIETETIKEVEFIGIPYDSKKGQDRSILVKFDFLSQSNYLNIKLPNNDTLKEEQEVNINLLVYDVGFK